MNILFHLSNDVPKPMLVNGKQITREILKEVHEQVSGIARTPVVRAIAVQPSPATESYLSVKSRRANEAGMILEVIRLDDNATAEDVISALHKPGADALLVQLPLPEHLDTKAILAQIPLAKDADVLSEQAHDLFTTGNESALLPPVVSAVAEILSRAGVSPAGKQAMVLGKGWLVGAPVATWLAQQGAQVTSLDKNDDLAILKSAEIIVSGAGVPSLIHPEYLTEGVVLIDAGTSESGGSIVGDADPACADMASVFTPVPGGVGPVAVACLFRNVGILVTKGSLQSH